MKERAGTAWNRNNSKCTRSKKKQSESGGNRYKRIFPAPLALFAFVFRCQWQAQSIRAQMTGHAWISRFLFQLYASWPEHTQNTHTRTHPEAIIISMGRRCVRVNLFICLSLFWQPLAARLHRNRKIYPARERDRRPAAARSIVSPKAD